MATVTERSVSGAFGERFADRHIGPSPADRAAMLAAVGASSVDALMAEVLPDSIRLKAPLRLPAAETEQEYLRRLRGIADQNRVFRSYIGLGYHDTFTPSVIQRMVLENPGWYTPYTPYQAEIAQGRLEALINYQTMVTDLTGLDIASASLLDEATAAAEAMTLMRRTSKVESNVLAVDIDTHPQTLAVLATRAEPLGITIELFDPSQESLPACFGVILSYPSSSGRLVDLRAVAAAAHEAGALVTAATDLLALTLITAPGEWGADIAVGSAQRFGVPMGFGGPHAAFMATRDEHARTLPGRLVGVSTDAAGRPALRLALQTREQHIRREKATSNICTAQALLANMAAM